MLIRKPFDAILSLYNLNQTETHTSVVDPAIVLKNKTAWTSFVHQKLLLYLKYHLYWKSKKTGPGQKLVVFYDDIVRNVTAEVQRMTRFLGFNFSNKVLHCVNKNSEGSFRRKKGPEKMIMYSLLDDGIKLKLEKTYEDISKLFYEH